MSNQKRSCSNCHRNHSLVFVNGKWLCQGCMERVHDNGLDRWRNALEILVKEYVDYCSLVVTVNHPDDVHDARVNGRKIRAMLEFIGVSKSHELLKIIKKVHKGLNAIREADVFLQALQEKDPAHEVYKALQKIIKKKREKKYKLFIEEVSPYINDDFIGKINLFLQQELPTYLDGFDKDQALQSYEKSFALIVKSYQRLVDKKGKLDDETIKALHAVRIQSKALRYIYVELNDIADENYEEKIQYYKDMQSQFGDINDLRDWLYQLEKYENKLDVPKKELKKVKKELEGRLRELINQVDLKHIAKA